MRNVNDYTCSDGSAVEGMLDDKFYDSTTEEIFYDEYQKWGGLGLQTKDDDDGGQCLDEDDDAPDDQSQPNSPTQRTVPKSTPGTLAPGPNQIIPEPPKDGFEYEDHFGSLMHKYNY